LTRRAGSSAALLLEFVQFMQDILVICVEGLTRNTSEPTQGGGGKPFTSAVGREFRQRISE
jgi:hypothetical protein